jgi:hypothetical protein
MSMGIVYPCSFFLTRKEKTILASILDTVSVYQELLEAVWKDKYNKELPEDIELLLGELKFRINSYPLANTPINDELLKIENDTT